MLYPLIAAALLAVPAEPVPSRYYFTLFGGQSIPFRPRTAHTWATYAKATPTTDGSVYVESFTISWLPAVGPIRQPVARRAANAPPGFCSSASRASHSGQSSATITSTRGLPGKTWFVVCASMAPGSETAVRRAGFRLPVWLLLVVLLLIVIMVIVFLNISGDAPAAAALLDSGAPALFPPYHLPIAA